MISDYVYLYADLFAPEAGPLKLREEIPGGKKVDQKKLAQQLVLASLSELYQRKIIGLNLKIEGLLFIKSETVFVSKLKDGEILSGLEKQLFANISRETRLEDAVRLMLHMGDNPWEQVTNIVKKNITVNGIKKTDDKKTEEIFNGYTAVLREIKANGNLFVKIKESIDRAIEAREERPESE